MGSRATLDVSEIRRITCLYRDAIPDRPVRNVIAIATALLRLPVRPLDVSENKRITCLYRDVIPDRPDRPVRNVIAIATALLRLPVRPIQVKTKFVRFKLSITVH
jgi:hypothetical protein